MLKDCNLGSPHSHLNQNKILFHEKKESWLFPYCFCALARHLLLARGTTIIEQAKQASRSRSTEVSIETTSPRSRSIDFDPFPSHQIKASAPFFLPPPPLKNRLRDSLSLPPSLRLLFVCLACFFLGLLSSPSPMCQGRFLTENSIKDPLRALRFPSRTFQKEK